MRLFFVLIFFIFSNMVFAKSTIKIGAIFALTGTAYRNNINSLTPLKILVNEINKNGGIEGRKIDLIIKDNKSTALGSKIAAEEIVKDSVIAVIGAVWSSHSLAIAPVLQKNKIVMISPTSTNPKLTLIGDYIFRVCFNDNFQGKAIARFVNDDLKVKKVIVFTNEGNSYSPVLSKSFIKNFEKSGGIILDERHYLEDVTNYADLFKDFGILKPEVIVLTGYGRDSAFIISKAREMGIKTTFVGGDGFSDLMFDYAKKDDLRGVYFVRYWSEYINTEESKKFIRLMHKNNYYKSLSQMVLSYDAFNILIEAIKISHSLNPTIIKNTLFKIKYKGASGDISFDKNGNTKKQIIINKFSDNGIKYVKTIFPE